MNFGCTHLPVSVYRCVCGCVIGMCAHIYFHIGMLISKYLMITALPTSSYSTLCGSESKIADLAA